jgi:hypothetical protein
MNLVYCEGTITQGLNGEVLCSVDWTIVDATNTLMLLNGGFEPEAFSIAFVGMLLVWAVGLGVGLIVARVRQLKI